MTESQNMMLQMMQWFDNICRNNNLSYYIMSGTMLGAIRHKGFIPWDDDADIGMPRPDYNKFLEIVEKDTSDKYIVESPKKCKPDYAWPFAKIYNKDTTVVEKSGTPIARGVWIDIFPLDGIGCNIASVLYKYIKIRLLLKILKMNKLENKKRSLFKRAVLFIFMQTINKLYSNQNLIKKIDTVYSEKDYLKSKLIGDLVWGRGATGVMLKSIWGKPTEYEFCGSMLYGIEKYDMYLKKIYGNYMELPPVEKRVNHELVYVDLKHGWQSQFSKKALNSLKMKRQ